MKNYKAAHHPHGGVELTDEFKEALAQSAQDVRHHAAEELEQIFAWTDDVLERVNLLTMVEAGELAVHIEDGVVKFSLRGPSSRSINFNN